MSGEHAHITSLAEDTIELLKERTYSILFGVDLSEKRKTVRSRQ